MATFVDHAGLNTLVSSSFDDTNTITSGVNYAVASIPPEEKLVGINLHRNGPYGYSTWKQLRASENPVTRRHREINKMTFVVQPGPIRNLMSSTELRVRDRHSILYSYTEPALTQKAYPLVWNVGRHFKDEDGNVDMENPNRFSIISSYGNNEIAFANDKVSKLHNFNPDEEQTEYVAIKDMYLENGLNKQDSPLTHWEFLQYRETIFPKATQQFVSQTRTRPNFSNFYRHNRMDRNRIVSDRVPMTTGSFGRRILGYANLTDPNSYAISASSWPLDARYDFVTKTTGSGYGDGSSTIKINHLIPYSDRDGTGVVLGQNSGYSGILQNNHSQFNTRMDYNQTDGSLENNFQPSPYYSRRHALHNTSSVANPSGMPIPETSSLTSLRLFAGQALWEAGSKRQVRNKDGTYTSAPKVPFYDTYESYVEEVRKHGKNYSIIPEFRMSTQIEDYIRTDGAIELDMFDVFGGISGSDDSSKSKFYEIYSNTDFMKNFEVIADDHKEFTNGKVLSLRCKAIKKFLPYEGFYPCQRTVDLAKRFYDSYSGSVSYTNTDAAINYFSAEDGANSQFQALLVPLFAPGILYNTIKSGVAVDYPIELGQTFPYRDGLAANQRLPNGKGNFEYLSRVAGTGVFDKRIPFEALVEPTKHLSQIDISFGEPHPSGTISASVTWDGSPDVLYSKMTSNFLAETINFFLPNGQLTSLVSRPQSKLGILENGEVYGMRIKMRRSMDKPRISIHHAGNSNSKYVPPQDIIKKAETDKVRETFTMYSRPSAFGPAILQDTTFLRSSSGSVFDFDEFGKDLIENYNGASTHHRLVKDSRHGYNFAYTPPYYHGEAWCDIWITGSGEELNMLQIQNKVTQSFTRFDGSHYTSSTTEAISQIGLGLATHPLNAGVIVEKVNAGAVQLSSSLNIKGFGSITKGRTANTLVVDSGVNEESRWVIQTKMETPMLNFNHVTAPDHLTLPEDLCQAACVPRGMWHQYGRIPELEDGVFMEVGPIPETWQKVVGVGSTNRSPDHENQPVRDLSEFLGFSGEPAKLGQLAQQKTIHEAVVAIPFIEESGKKKFFKIDKEKVDTFKIGLTEENEEDYKKLTNEAPAGQIGRSVLNQMKKMKKYIFPPSFDFMNYDTDDVTPIAMYIFEFSHTLSQVDLQDIWQNLPPDIGTEMQVSEVAITHPLIQKELLGEGGRAGNEGIEMPEKLKWMVFKVKQRASANYFKKTIARNSEVNTEPDSGNVTQDEFGKSSTIQYNWPYDFFSLVEMVKIDAEVELGNIDFTNYTDNIPNWNAVQADPAKIAVVTNTAEEDLVETEVGELDVSIGINVGFGAEMVAVDDVGVGRFGLLSGGTANTVDGTALQGYGNELGTKSLLTLLSRGQWSNTSAAVIEPYAIPINEGSFYNAWQNTWEKTVNEFKAENPVGWAALEDQAARNPDGAGHIKTQQLQSVRNMVGQALNGMKQGDYYTGGGQSLSSMGGQNMWLLFVAQTFQNAGQTAIGRMIMDEFTVTL